MDFAKQLTLLDVSRINPVKGTGKYLALNPVNTVVKASIRKNSIFFMGKIQNEFVKGIKSKTRQEKFSVRPGPFPWMMHEMPCLKL